MNRLYCDRCDADITGHDCIRIMTNFGINYSLESLTDRKLNPVAFEYCLVCAEVVLGAEFAKFLKKETAS